MQILTKGESAAWCSAQGFCIDGEPTSHDTRIASGLCFKTAGKQTVVEAFVRNTVNAFDFDEAIVWAVDWWSYKPDEMAVVQRFRLAAGERRQLIDAPGHVFNKDEAGDCIGLFNLFVQYGWDAFMFIPKSQLAFFTHHHGIQFVAAPTEEGRAEVKAILLRHQLSLCGDQHVDSG